MWMGCPGLLRAFLLNREEAFPSFIQLAFNSTSLFIALT